MTEGMREGEVRAAQWTLGFLCLVVCLFVLALCYSNYQYAVNTEPSVLPAS